MLVKHFKDQGDVTRFQMYKMYLQAIFTKINENIRATTVLLKGREGEKDKDGESQSKNLKLIELHCDITSKMTWEYSENSDLPEYLHSLIRVLALHMV